MAAGISAAHAGKSAIICERMPKIGKKILASGNGRCNLLNEKLDESFYNKEAQGLVKSVFSKFGFSFIIKFFNDMGLEVYSEEGKIFPVTNQASSVLKILEIELKKLGMPIELDFEVCRISRSNGKFIVTSKSGKTIECDKLIMAGGGKSYPSLGSDGSCYRLAKELGHKIVEPVPAGVALVVKDKLCHLLQGQRISANVKAMIDGKEICSSTGDLLFTKYGLSGTSILEVSEKISIAIHRYNKKDIIIYVDMIPFMEADGLTKKISQRIKQKLPAEELTAGILPNKFGYALKDEFKNLTADNMANVLKKRHFNVIGTRGWNEADFTSGGVDIKGIREGTLESATVKGLYFAGEIIDVCGKIGGYNLAWAWASGCAAGLTE